MPRSKKISVLDTYFILLLSLGITNHVILIPVLLQTAGRDAWMGVILTSFIQLIWLYIFYLIMKRTNQQSIFSWFKERFGTIIGWIFIIITTCYFFLLAMIMLRETTTWINVTYLPQTPKIFVSIVIVILCVYIAFNGIRSIAIVSGILLPLVWILGHFVATTNLQFKDYSLLTPLFVNGYMPTMKTMIVASGGFMEMIVLIFFQHHIRRKISYLHIVLLGLLLAGLTLGPLMGAIANFGPVLAKQYRYPAFEQWMLVTITKYITHIDFLALYQWLAGAVIRIALFLFIISDSISFKNSSRRLLFLVLLGASLSVLSLTPAIDRQIELYVLGNYALACLIFLLSLSLAIFLATAFKAKTKR